MSLAGFEHVFAHAVEVHLPEGMTIRVAPPIVTALLKIIAWVDDPFRRGLDMRALVTGDDARFVDRFLGRLLAEDEEGQFDDESDFSAKSFRGQIRAFRKGFAGGFEPRTSCA